MRAVELTYTFFSPDTFLESGGKRGRLGKGVCVQNFAKLIPALLREEERPTSPPHVQDRMWEDPHPHSSAPPSPELSPLTCFMRSSLSWESGSSPQICFLNDSSQEEGRGVRCLLQAPCLSSPSTSSTSQKARIATEIMLMPAPFSGLQTHQKIETPVIVTLPAPHFSPFLIRK